MPTTHAQTHFKIHSYSHLRILTYTSTQAHKYTVSVVPISNTHTEDVNKRMVQHTRIQDTYTHTNTHTQVSQNNPTVSSSHTALAPLPPKSETNTAKKLETNMQASASKSLFASAASSSSLRAVNRPMLSDRSRASEDSVCLTESEDRSTPIPRPFTAPAETKPTLQHDDYITASVENPSDIVPRPHTAPTPNESAPQQAAKEPMGEHVSIISNTSRLQQPSAVHIHKPFQQKKPPNPYPADTSKLRQDTGKMSKQPVSSRTAAAAKPVHGTSARTSDSSVHQQAAGPQKISASHKNSDAKRTSTQPKGINTERQRNAQAVEDVDVDVGDDEEIQPGFFTSGYFAAPTNFVSRLKPPTSIAALLEERMQATALAAENARAAPQSRYNANTIGHASFSDTGISQGMADVPSNGAIAGAHLFGAHTGLVLNAVQGQGNLPQTPHSLQTPAPGHNSDSTQAMNTVAIQNNSSVNHVDGTIRRVNAKNEDSNMCTDGENQVMKGTLNSDSTPRDVNRDDVSRLASGRRDRDNHMQKVTT
jgi:hypothetical protein